MSNVAYLIGQSARVVFDEKRREKHAFDGKKEPFLLLKLLANENSQNTYFIFDLIAPTILKKYFDQDKFEKDFKYKNVRFIVNEIYDKSFWKNTPEEELESHLTEKQLKSIDTYRKFEFSQGEFIQNFREHIDYGICFSFPIDLYPYGKIVNGKRTTSPFMSIYYQFTLQALDKMNFPWIVYTVDMRYIRDSLKVRNLPKAIFGFETKSHTVNGKKVPIIYGGSDLLLISSSDGLVDRKKIKIEDKVKRINSYTNKTKLFDRLSIVKEFVLDQFDNSINYGNFEEDNPQLKPILIRPEMSKNMSYDRYNFIAPNQPGVTQSSAKPWECLYHKVIPFMHKNFGTKEWREFHGWPNFLFVSTPEELKEKVELLNNSDEKYYDLLNKTQNILKDSYLDGTFILKNLNKVIDEYCK